MRASAFVIISHDIHTIAAGDAALAPGATSRLVRQFASPSRRRPGCPVRSGRALGDEHELATWAIWGFSHIQRSIAVGDQA